MASSVSESGKVGAFFDLDRTLLEINSGTAYAKFEYREGRITSWQLVQSMFWAILYHLSLLDLEKVYSKAIRHYRGVNAELLRQRTYHWFESEIAQRAQRGGLRALEQHREKGHRTVLLTNASSYISEIVTETYALDGWIANHFPVDTEGNLKGEFEAPLCYGEGKVIRAERYGAEHGLDLDLSYFYTDSLSDLPMLERVGHPFVVNPDPRLKRVAKREGWPILDWSK
jgi:HAD superfamily hydrolase (TIGR01490 family)